MLALDSEGKEIRRRLYASVGEPVNTGSRDAVVGKKPRVPLNPVAAVVWGTATVVPLIFLGLFFVWPVGAMLARGFVDSGTLDLTGFGEVLAQQRTWRIVWETL